MYVFSHDLPHGYLEKNLGNTVTADALRPSVH